MFDFFVEVAHNAFAWRRASGFRLLPGVARAQLPGRLKPDA